MITSSWETRLRRVLVGAALLSTVSLGMGCNPSEEDLANGKVRASLAAEQSKLVEHFKGSKRCAGGAAAIEKWRADSKDAIATSDAWWNALSESTKDKLYNEFPAFSQANKDRASLLVFCGSDRALWDPSA